ncbi:IPT/TIG domain-containing protein [Salegentibacter echinorum]|uniref:IPT/TIG domain-containing protein n=1 Tax=Salegentibacter echinorum TaxID=1073325 RepID=A0A1M5HFJ7_SALEC|nr:IPT/TIG domain-containing protein [Salegentibacter echinorum]SHG14711.1 IPT/TIG domain-containing protein [Salegentibacter echinorum]
MKTEYKRRYQGLTFGSLLLGLLIFFSCEADLEIDRSLEEIRGKQPEITSFSPESTPLLGNVTVKGSALNFVEKAFINGVETPIHQRVNANQIVIEAGVDVTSGPIKLVTGAGKEVVSEGDLNITYPTPSISSEIPTSSKVNENITIEGENMDAVTKVKFGEKEGFIEFKEKNALVIKTPLNNESPIALTLFYNTEAGEQTTVLEEEYEIIIPKPTVNNPPRLMTKGNPVTVIGENMNLVTSVSVGGKETAIDEVTPTSLSFAVPEGLETGYYPIKFVYSEDQETILSNIPYINGEFMKLLDFDDYPIDLPSIQFKPSPITATQQYISDPEMQPAFPPNSDVFYNVVHMGYTGSSVSDIRINDIADNEEKLETVLDEGAFNNTPYLHFWYKSDGVSSVKIYVGDKRRELDSEYRSTNGEWVLVAVNMKGFTSTAADISKRLDVTLQPTSDKSAKEVKEQSIDWFIITDKVLTEFGAEDWSGDEYFKAEG